MSRDSILIKEHLLNTHVYLEGGDYIITLREISNTSINRTEQNRTEFITINVYKVHRLKYKVYMHNITRDSRKKEDSF
mgnify:CR=1 FL=1